MTFQGRLAARASVLGGIIRAGEFQGLGDAWQLVFACPAGYLKFSGGYSGSAYLERLWCGEEGRSVGKIQNTGY